MIFSLRKRSSSCCWLRMGRSARLWAKEVIYNRHYSITAGACLWFYGKSVKNCKSELQKQVEKAAYPNGNVLSKPPRQSAKSGKRRLTSGAELIILTSFYIFNFPMFCKTRTVFSGRLPARAEAHSVSIRGRSPPRQKCEALRAGESWVYIFRREFDNLSWYEVHQSQIGLYFFCQIWN